MANIKTKRKMYLKELLNFVKQVKEAKDGKDVVSIIAETIGDDCDALDVALIGGVLAHSKDLSVIDTCDKLIRGSVFDMCSMNENDKDYVKVKFKTLNEAIDFFVYRNGKLYNENRDLLEFEYKFIIDYETIEHLGEAFNSLLTGIMEINLEMGEQDKDIRKEVNDDVIAHALDKLSKLAEGMLNV